MMKNEEMTNEEMVRVINADSRGEEIQFKVKAIHAIGLDCTVWQETDRPGWDFHRCDFRVKPEPPHCYGHIYEDGSFGCSTFIDRQSAEEHPYDSKMQVVKLILAPDEEQQF